ncbi:hypothetical protein [Paenibacillus sp. PDC88]|uniref:hypothetical protein n=1 Tax=Paenibacillus TaxID=44249 RepID=UPI000894CFC5|nr:hypothetical protein [Paenibacillus sp. PDC88]SDX82784.1 hypothetical protein SAMN05518848_11823 [Paenibacillus sp. PDC88]
MSEKLKQVLSETNELLRGLTAAVNGLANQIQHQHLKQPFIDRSYKLHPSGRRVHSKVEELGLTEKVVDLLNKDFTYVQISNQLGNQVSKSAIHRFAKRHKFKA